MATQFQQLDPNWLDITASLSLSVGIEYLLQNAGPVTIFIQEAPTAPDATETGHKMLSNTSLPILIGTDNFYARAEKTAAQLIVDLGFSS